MLNSLIMDAQILTTDIMQNDAVYSYFQSVLSSIEENTNLTPQIRIEIKNLLELTCILASMQNHPENRLGKEKAEFIAGWLKYNKVEKVRIIPVENLDPTKTANECGVWYVVEAVIGDDYHRDNDVLGAMLVHHDQITPKKIVDFTFKDGNLHHSWILDDSLQVAAAMIETVNFQKFWNENHARLKLKGRVVINITDGEDVNTLGYRALLAKRLEQNILRPLTFMIVGESTGRNHSKQYMKYNVNNLEFSSANVPGICYTSRGKISGYVEGNVRNNNVYRIFQYYSARMRQIQRFLYSSSIDKTKPVDREVLNPTAVSTTVLEIDRDKVWTYWEARTNEKMDVYKSFESIEHIFALNSQLISEKYGYNIYQICKFDIDIRNVVKYKRAAKKLIVNLNEGSHPGNYNPFDQNDVFSILELILYSLKDNDRNKVSKILIGSRSKTNIVPGTAVVEFSEDINWEEAFILIRQSNCHEMILDFEKEGLRLIQESIKVYADPHVPARNHMKVSQDKWWIVDTAIKNIIDETDKFFGVKINSSEILRAFDFMHDGGVTTMKEYIDKIWPDGSEGAIMIGAGNAKLLHGDEYMTVNDLLFARIQFKNLLQKLFTQAHQE